MAKGQEARLQVEVLFVEDEPLTREAFLDMLRRKVEKVYAAGNGEEGLALFLEHRPQVVITDIRMAIMDGLKMIQKIKAVDPRARAIITSAYNETEYLMEAIRMGIHAYLLKPIDAKKLFSALDVCAEMVLLERKVREQDEEREKLIAQLKQALAEIKTLRGLIPICASCKKIRDDQGEWMQIEPYLQQHSEAEFSHGLCPECLERLYPRLGEKEERKDR